MDDTSAYDAEHYLAAGENASRDADLLVSKFAVAGLSVVVGVAGLTSEETVTLGWSAAAFALAAITAVINQRIGADSLRCLWERTVTLGSSVDARKELDGRFKAQQMMNWTATILVVLGFGLAAGFAIEVIGAGGSG